MKDKHYVLSLKAGNYGSFEHAWNLAKNLNSKGYDVDYFSHWWNENPYSIDVKNSEKGIFDISKLLDATGVFHLQTHTWEYENYLDKIFEKREGKKLIYNLHAIIPYFYLDSNLKQPFLNGEIKYSDLKLGLEEKMSPKEKSQLKAFERADYLFAISKNHKKVIELMGIDTPVYVFENNSDFENISEEINQESDFLAQEFRENLQVDNVLLYCGRAENGKGIPGLFEAFRRIREDNPSSKLVFLGEKESGIDKFYSMGLDSESLPFLEFVPWIDKNDVNAKKNFLKYYKASDVLIQPMITRELYAKTVIDAMSIGVPTITTESDYTIGSSKNADEIYESFNFMKNNPDEVKRIVGLAKEKVKRENTWDSYISRMEKIVSD